MARSYTGSSNEEYPEEDIDDDIDALLDLIEHEPKMGGLFGVSHAKHSEYISKVNTAIAKLEQ